MTKLLTGYASTLREVTRQLHSCKQALLAVGPLSLRHLCGLQKALAAVPEVRILMDSTPSQDRVAGREACLFDEAYARDFARAMLHPSHDVVEQYKRETTEMLSKAIGHLPQSQASRSALQSLMKQVESGALQFRVPASGTLQVRASVFCRSGVAACTAITGTTDIARGQEGQAVTIDHLLTGKAATQVRDLYEDLWAKALDITPAVREALRHSWALAEAGPEDIYLKLTWSLLQDRLDEKETLWEDELVQDLADFQQVAVRQAIKIIRSYGGVFVADVVGLGKSYIGAAVMQHFARHENLRGLIICPAPLLKMWERYNEVYDLNANIISMGMLRESDRGNILLDDVRYQGRDFVLIDESHNFRHSDTQRYHVLEGFLGAGKRCCLLTATPQNKSAEDIYNQMRLFRQPGTAQLPIDPPSLRQYFNRVAAGERPLQDLLQHVLVRRTRRHILRWYGIDADTQQPVDPEDFGPYARGEKRAGVLVGGQLRFFPRRRLQTQEYSIEAAYGTFYPRLRDAIAGPGGASLRYSRFNLYDYLVPAAKNRRTYAQLRSAGTNLRGLMRVLLFKRLESSVHAFRCTVERMRDAHQAFLGALGKGVVITNDEALRAHLAEDDSTSHLAAHLRAETSADAADFDLERLAEDIGHDLAVLQEVLDLTQGISVAKDAKLHALCALLGEAGLRKAKVLLFTQYADTARYLFQALGPEMPDESCAMVCGGDRDIASVIGRFAPRANPALANGKTPPIRMLIATDVLSEGLNLQDCSVVVNYDLHWNPVRLIQRFGRIDRIGTTHEEVRAVNFLPETGIEENLGLHERLTDRIREIQEVIGEDAGILHPDEEIMEEAIYAIYEREDSSVAEEAAGDSLPLAEAEQLLRHLRDTQPEGYAQIAGMADGLRCACTGQDKGTAVLCEAGTYRKLFFVERDLSVRPITPEALMARLAGAKNSNVAELPLWHDKAVAKSLERFRGLVQNRDVSIEHGRTIPRAQRYALDKLELWLSEDKANRGTEFSVAHGENLLRIFSADLPAACKKALGALRRTGVQGEDLVRHLTSLSERHRLTVLPPEVPQAPQAPLLPKVVCSISFV